MAETFTLNYNWTKPEVGASFDVWGGFLNTDLDGIDSTVKAISNSVAAITVPGPSSTTPAMDGTAAVGTATTYARADHVHPSDTSKYSTTNPAGYQAASDVAAALAPYLLKSGGTMTGAITLAADPAAALQPATKQYVDAHSPPNLNRIDNGDMYVSQRGTGSVSISSGGLFTVDRWFSNATQNSKYTVGQNFNGSALAPGFQYYFGVQSASAFSVAATDRFSIGQGIEADTIGDFAWGTAGAQAAMLSFWAISSIGGTFSGALQGATPTRSFVFTYSLVANTWTRVTIPIAGDISGTWTLAGPNRGLSVLFDLGAGSTFRNSVSGWQTGTIDGSTGSVSIVAVNAAKFAFTGVKLELSVLATAFFFDPLAVKIARCQRYLQVIGPIMFGGCATAGGQTMWAGTSITLMRATPTVTFSNIVYGGASGLAVAGAISPSSVSITFVSAGAGNANVTFTAQLSAEI